MIVLQNHIILVFPDLNSSSQIAWLKTTFKYQSIIIIAFLLSISLKFWVISIELGDLLVESRLSWRSIGVILSLIDRVFIWRQFNQVVFINVWCRVSLSFLRGPVDAIVHDSFTLRLVTVHFFCFLSSKFVAHRGIELVDGLEVFAHIFESRPVSQERLFDTCPRKLQRRMTMQSSAIFRTGPFFIVGLIFEIELVFLLGQWITSVVRKIAIILSQLRCLLIQSGFEGQFGLILTLASHLVWTALWNNRDLISRRLSSILKLHWWY